MLYPGATARYDFYVGRGSRGIWLKNVYCTGSELRLIDCRHSAIGVHTCSRAGGLGVRCRGITVLLYCLKVVMSVYIILSTYQNMYILMYMYVL